MYDTVMFRKKNPNENLDTAVSILKSQLGENLHSCMVYGSVVRGHYVDGESDINLLVMLKESTPQAHQAIGRIVRDHPPIDPFTVGLKGFERSMKVFALKFMSIKRDYKVLHGEDPFKDFALDAALDRFLCEQSIRNLRLRLVHTFVMHGQDRKRYSRYLEHLIPPLFVDLSEIARVNGKEVPGEFNERITILEDTFGTKLQVLNDLLRLKNNFTTLSEGEIFQFHTQIFQLLNHVVFWVEEKWSLPVPGGSN